MERVLLQPAKKDLNKVLLLLQDLDSVACYSKVKIKGVNRGAEDFYFPA